MSFYSFKKTDLLKVKAGKGKAWIRKTYRILKFRECIKCSSPFIGKTQKCTICLVAEAEAKRWKTCECGNHFRLVDGQSGGTRTCPLCIEDDYHFFFWRTIDYIQSSILF